MADLLIKVSPEAMKDKGNTLKTAATRIKTLTDEIKNEISKMKSAWEGEAAEKFVNKFNGLSDDFEERYTVINEYGDFLIKAAEEFAQGESEIVNQEDELIS